MWMRTCMQWLIYENWVASCLEKKSPYYVTAFKDESDISKEIGSMVLSQLLRGKASAKSSVKPIFQLNHVYFSLKPCKQGHNSLRHQWISVRWLWGKYLAWLCVMSVQWNLVLRAAGKCPLATRCAQNLKTDDRPACVRQSNHNVHMIHRRGVTQATQSYGCETNVFTFSSL